MGIPESTKSCYDRQASKRERLIQGAQNKRHTYLSMSHPSYDIRADFIPSGHSV